MGNEKTKNRLIFYSRESISKLSSLGDLLDNKNWLEVTIQPVFILIKESDYVDQVPPALPFRI